MAKKKNSAAKKSLQQDLGQNSNRPPQAKSPVKKSSVNTKRSKSSASALSIASWSGPLNVFHYLFFLAIFVAINGFNASATIGGPSITDHLFVKNFFTSNILMPITLVFILVMLIRSNKIIIHWNLQSKIITLMMAYGFLSLVWAYHPGFAVTKITIWVMGFVAYFWAYDVIRRGGLPLLLQVIFFSGVTVAAIGLWQVYFEPSPTEAKAMRAAGESVTRLIDMAAGPSSSFGNRNMANISRPIAI